jgi:hypothetical protein
MLDTIISNNGVDIDCFSTTDSDNSRNDVVFGKKMADEIDFKLSNEFFQWIFFVLERLSKKLRV